MIFQFAVLVYQKVTTVEFFLPKISKIQIIKLQGPFGQGEAVELEVHLACWWIFGPQKGHLLLVTGDFVPLIAAKTNYNWLVVLTMTNMKVNGKDYPMYYGKWKMIETTNQINERVMYSKIM